MSELLGTPSIYLPVLESLKNFNLNDDVPHIQCAPKQIELDISSFSNSTAYLDAKGYSSRLATEMEMIARIENLVEHGNEFVHMMYTYRSISRALPEVSIETPSDLNPEEKTEIIAKRNEINRKVVEILRPEMLKIKDLINFVLDATHCLRDCILHLTQIEIQKEVIPEGLHVAMIKLIDVLVKLDNLKDMKSSLKNDFSRYKRAIGSQLSSEALEELNQLQQFLSNPDSKKSKNYIFVMLRDEIKRMAGHEAALLDLLVHSTSMMENELNLTPDEKFRAIRVLPHLMLLIDGNADDPKSLNVFRAHRNELAPVQKLVRKTPIVPLYGDMSITIPIIISRAAHFDAAISASWGADLSDSAVIEASYSIGANWEGVRLSYEEYTTKFTFLMNQLSVKPFRKSVAPESVNLGEHVSQIAFEGLRLLSAWTYFVQMMFVWKYTHPCSEEQMKELSGHTSPIDPSSPKESLPLLYERAIRYNLRKDELSMLVDVISMIKSLASLLDKAEQDLAPILRLHIHHSVQQLVQGDLLPILHKVDKRKNSMLPLLLQIRMTIADWKGGVEPREDYKAYHSKQKEVLANHNPRVAAPSTTQLQIFRTQIRSLYDERSSLRKGTFFRGSDLSKENIAMLSKFYQDSYLYPYLLNFSGTLQSVSDLGDLWFREFYLDLTKCIQFPIDTSIPWLLTEHVISQKSSSDAAMTEKLLFSMDIYNDAARRALFVLKQQHLYDEIQAEANLVFDQLVYLLADEIYTYYTNLSASTLMERVYQQKLEELTSKSLSVPCHRYEIAMSQRHVQLLGRSVDLCFLITQHANNKLHNDLDVCIRRFESGDLTGIVDLRTVLSVLRRTHESLSRFLQLDDFDLMLSEVNESFSPTCFQSRISFHALKTLVTDLFPNFAYNSYTQRFVRAPQPMKPAEYSKVPKQATISHAYGPLCFKAFEAHGKLYRGFVGRIHLEALATLVGHSDLFMLVEECLRNILEKMQGLNEYVDALQESIPPLSAPKSMFGSIGGFGYFEGKLKSLLEYDDLKPEVFQALREIGNSLAFFRDLSHVLSVQGSFAFNCLAPFVGLSPSLSSSPIKVTPSSTPLGAVFGSISSMSLSEEALQAKPPDSPPPVIFSDHFYTDSTATELPELGAKLVHCLSQPLQQNGTRNLFKGVLGRIDGFCYQLNLFNEWGRARPVKGNSRYSLEQETEKTFHRLWSALSFLFCLPNRDPVVEGEEGEEGAVASSDQQQFGHGFYFAGCLFVHLLDQRPIFELMDFSGLVLRIRDLELLSARPQFGGAVDQTLQEDTDKFLENASLQKNLQDELFSLYEGLYPQKMSTRGKPLRTFRPVEAPPPHSLFIHCYLSPLFIHFHPAPPYLLPLPLLPHPHPVLLPPLPHQTPPLPPPLHLLPPSNIQNKAIN